MRSESTLATRAARKTLSTALQSGRQRKQHNPKQAHTEQARQNVHTHFQDDVQPRL
jgi:hypothetical protein